MTLTLTGNDAGNAMWLQVTSDVDVAAGDLHIVAIDANGSHDLRGVHNVALFAGVTQYLRDYEFAQGDSVTYAVRTPGDAEQITIDVEYRATWITFPLKPGWSIQVPTAGDLADDLAVKDGFLDVIGSDFPVLAGGRVGGRDGTVTFATDTFQQAYDIVLAGKKSRVAMLRIPDPVEASKYIGIERISYRKLRERNTRWEVAIQYREVARPVGMADGSSSTQLTHGEVLALGMSFSEAMVEWPTFIDWGYTS